MSEKRIAILIDAGFFLKRLPKLVAPKHCSSPGKIVACIRHMCRNHVKHLTGETDARWHRHVHRIFYYDAIPYEGKAHHPVDNRPIDFAKSNVAKERHELFDLLRRQRKVALRLGKVTKDRNWTISPLHTKKLLRTRQWVEALNGLNAEDVADKNNASVNVELSADEARSLIALRDLWQSLDGGAVQLGLRQKGVDMRIGLDISTLTLKKQVDTIILVSGDSDFVPAAKLARREGMEFILDPLWQKVSDDLYEHIDGLQSGIPKPADPHENETPEPAVPPKAAQKAKKGTA